MGRKGRGADLIGQKQKRLGLLAHARNEVTRLHCRLVDWASQLIYCGTVPDRSPREILAIGRASLEINESLLQ